MHHKALRDMVKKTPFEPFEIVFSSGDRYPVQHPENMIMKKEGVLVAFKSSWREPLPDEFAILSCLHIAAAEPASGKKQKKR